MIESLAVLGKVGMLCGVGFIVATGFEWFNDLEVKPKSRVIRLGNNNEGGSVENERKLNDIRKKVRSEG